MRIDVATYSMLFDIIEPQITGSSHYRKPIMAKEKFAVTQRYLATGIQGGPKK